MSRRPDYADPQWMHTLAERGLRALVAEHFARYLEEDCPMSADTDGRRRLDELDPFAPRFGDQYVPLTRADAKRLLLPLATELTALTVAVKTLTRKVNHMSAREDAADARQQELIGLVRDHITALQNDNTALRAALANADADKAAALEAESDADAGRQEQVNAALEELAGVQSGGDVPPADSGSGDAPADGGDTDVPADGSNPADGAV